MRWESFMILLIAVCAACTDKTKVPKGILPKEKMQQVLWDVMMVDQYAEEHLFWDSVKDVKKERTILYQKVFDMHKISRDKFNKSFTYYMGRPDLTKAIFDTLSARGARRTHEREEKLRLQDSIRARALRNAKLRK